MGDSLPRVDVNEAEPWPEWKVPPTPSRDQVVPSAFASTEAQDRENLRAAIAQASVVLPLIGPGLSYAVSLPGTAPRREAAKAFNGQLSWILLMLAAWPLLLVAYTLYDPWFDFESFIAIPLVQGGLFLGWLIQAITGMVSARKGKDWTSPLSRILQVRVLPDDDERA
ncbi:MAG TPA: DUF4870 domain-containing protein [Candidatus Avipropionibacterium avicola]|uniref:DUF4870 domain-containing protein n=1 Tax=Candidatus Avipropionibacterium avicola TaxID=2840701 RepID=A0A9D1KNE2_9ACTN|nr:DUF4870 domain-containing protein [Candidatus Avipropionibacterium avicola]